MSTLEIWRIYAPFLLRGAIVTLQITALGLALSIILGLIGAIIRLSRSRVGSGLARLYIEVVRGTPELLQIFLLYFGLAQYGVRLPAFVAAFLWLGIFGGAYASEIFRAGMQSIDKGQLEAAAALGLPRSSVLRRVVLPQAVALVLPPLASFGILQLKASSLAYMIGVDEIMHEANIGALGTFRTLDIYVLAALLYLCLCYPLSKIVERLERRVERYR